MECFQSLSFSCNQSVLISIIIKEKNLKILEVILKHAIFFFGQQNSNLFCFCIKIGFRSNQELQQQLMKLQFEHFFSMKSMIIPEMRNFHHKKMQNFIRGDYFTRQNKNSFILNSEGKLVYTKILIQILPTINMGLQYVVYFRKFLPSKKIICNKNQNQLVYSSKSFCDSIEIKFSNSQLISYITPQKQQQIGRKGSVELILEEGEFELNFIDEFIQKQIQYLFLQIVDRNMQDIADPSHVKQTTDSKPFGTEIEHYIKDVHLSEHQSQFQMLQAKGQNQRQYKALQSEKKKTTLLKQTFEIILNKSKRKSIKSANLVIKFAGFIRIALLIAVILIKLGNEKDYLTALQINSDYHTFMLLLSGYALKFKLINLFTYQKILPNSTDTLLKQIQSYQSLGPAMDNFLYLFDISTLSQTQTTFAVNKNNTYQTRLQNNFLGFSDNILNPITNLNLSNTSSFNFPFALQLNTKSLSSTASFFFQFITNTVYTFLPNFRVLKKKVMNPILDKQLNNFSIIIVLNVFILIVTGIWIMCIIYKHRRIILLKHLAYNFLQFLKGDLVAQKENRCLYFIQKYQTYTQTDPQQLLKNSDHDKKSQLSHHCFSSVDNQNQKLSLEHSQNLNPKIQASHKEIQKPKRKFPIRNENHKKEGQSIFKFENFISIFMRYLLPCIPLIIYTVIHSSYEVTFNKNFKTMLFIHQNLQNMQQDIVNLQLYSMQYASHSEYLQKYLNFSKTIQSLITQLFTFEKMLLNNNKFNNLPLITHFISIIYYGDVCQLEQQGSFSYSDFKFEGRGNLNYCRSINYQMLTKGVISSLLSYIQSANTIFYANSKINTYNISQKMSFLNDNIFTDIARLTDFFTIILDTALYSLQMDYKQYVSKSAIIIVSVCGFFIFWLLIMIFLFRRYYLNIIKWDVLQIHSIFTMISYETVLGDKQLKQFMLENVSQFNIMR